MPLAVRSTMTTPLRIEPVLELVQAALDAREPAKALELLTPFASLLESDLQLAAAWLTVLRVNPSRAHVVEDVGRILTRWPGERALQHAGCDALIRAAEVLGPDVPSASDGPAVRAVAVADANLQQLTAAERADPKVGGAWRMNRANALRLAHRYPEAASEYAAALELDPNNGEWWFDLCLLHKAQGNFADGLAAAERAHAQLGDRRGVLWNTAICATAVGEGERAAAAMRKLGFNARVLPSGMPHVDDLPPMQVRVATRGSGHGFGGADLDRGVAFELLWVSPASPVHGVVQSPTFREGSVDYGDVVLWDGTPIGITHHEGRAVPRFPLLSKLREGDERRMRFLALEQDEGDAAALGRDLPETARFFVQRAHVEMLCPRCAAGDHMRKHEHGAPEPHRLVYGKLIVDRSCELQSFRAELDASLKRHPKVQLVIPSLLEALGETKAAGRAHQLWRGLERSAIKSSDRPRA
jgi:hypothetical protein